MAGLEVLWKILIGKPGVAEHLWSDRINVGVRKDGNIREPSAVKSDAATNVFENGKELHEGHAQK
jgi:hypothetical protein